MAWAGEHATANCSPSVPWVCHLTDLHIMGYRKGAAQRPSPEAGIQVRSTAIYGEGPCCTTPLAELTPIDPRGMFVPKVHKGVYLICRTIVPSRISVSVTTLVQDRRGDVESASFYDFQESLSSDPSEWLPEGTILLIKESSMKYGSQSPPEPMVHVGRPSDVLFLHESQSLLRSTAWHRPVQKTFDELKVEGDRLYGANHFGKAIQLYDLALQMEPGNPVGSPSIHRVVL
jgi:hypothetical protein